jgi:hypothetical protein
MSESYKGQVRDGVVVFEPDAPRPVEGAKVRVEPIEAADPARPRTLADRLRSVIGRADGLPTDLAAQPDHYLHGQPKR